MEDRAEQNRTEILLKPMQKSCGDGNELVTLEQLQEVHFIVDTNIIFFINYIIILYWNTYMTKNINAVKISVVIFNMIYFFILSL